ncbi:hypothetical protein [Kribbella sp. VKM Ac-2569]|uniref:hypothetical protein n=1 Tax=Kribbella sp. VKM Ac-2569 TaxID=2512220 RepID=UPI001300AD83|nr:hypothetical protein [Kribbella sp. VKM Ac-2569]
MAISVVTSSDLITEGGRAVTPTRLLWTGWADAVRSRMSWRAMALAYQSVRWTDTMMPAPVRGDAVSVQISEIAAGTVADDIERFGFDWVAGLAGLVLDRRRIAIVADAMPLPGVAERLRLFDAVCALLPYAYRARFSAATWAKANVEHRVLLTFSDTAARDQNRVVWKAALPRPHGSDASGYVDALLRLRNGEAQLSTSDIVQHLLAESDPRRYSDAAAALRALQRMDLPREVARAIRSGRGRLADVQSVLDEYRLEGLAPEIAQTLVRFLADRVDDHPAAGDLLVRIWSTETERQLGAYGRPLLSDAGLPRLHRWFDLARRAGRASELGLLRELLRPTETMPDLPSASASVALRLLSVPHGAIDDAATRQIVVGQPMIFIALLRHLLNHGRTDRAVELIELGLGLRGPAAEGHPWLVPFGFAIGRGEPTNEQWQALRDADDRVWLVLLQIADFGGHSMRLFAAMWPFLVDRAGRQTTPARDAAFDAELAVLAPTRCGLPEIEWASIDVLNLIRFGSMPGLRAGAVPHEHYRERFWTVWYSPSLADRRSLLSAPLVRAIFPESSTAAGAELLMSVIPSDDLALVQHAAQTIAREIDARPDQFGSLVFRPEWIDQIRRVSVRPGFWVYLELCTAVEANSSARQIAARYVQGLQASLSFAQMEPPVDRWIRRQPALLVEQLLIDLWQQDVAEGAELLRRGVAEGRYGGRAAQQWRDFVQERQLFAQWLAGRSKPPRRPRTAGHRGAGESRLSRLFPGRSTAPEATEEPPLRANSSEV